MVKIFKKLLLITLVGSLWPYSVQAESFLLAQPTAQRRNTIHQLKQKIAELLTALAYDLSKSIHLRARLQKILLDNSPFEKAKKLLRQITSMIELEARLQIELYNRIRDLADGNSNAFLNKASRAELSVSLQELEKIEAWYKSELQKLGQWVAWASATSSELRDQRGSAKQVISQKNYTDNELVTMGQRHEQSFGYVTKVLPFIQKGCTLQVSIKVG